MLATSPKLFCDDTHLPVMAKGKTLKGALFGYARDDSPWNGPLPPAVVYVYTDGRKHSSPLPQLAGFYGVLQVDGWRGFKALTASRDPGAIILAFCWNHARRGFFEVFESTKSPIAAEVKDEGLKVDDFIVKPLELDVLKAKLDRLSGYVASWSETSRNAETGAFLSIQLDATEDVSTLRLFGILHQDDKLALKDIPDRVAMTPRDDVSAG